LSSTVHHVTTSSVTNLKLLACPLKTSCVLCALLIPKFNAETINQMDSLPLFTVTIYERWMPKSN